jgi:hypothetical protein
MITGELRPFMFAKSAASPFPLLPRPARPSLVRIGVTVFSIVLAAVAAQTALSGISEGECLVWPGIGTCFTRDFSHRGFQKIKPGMTEAQVIALIGKPMHRGPGRGSPPGWPLFQRGDVVWGYSSDSSRLGGDWAWLAREVMFRNGKVVQTVKFTYHD